MSNESPFIIEQEATLTPNRLVSMSFLDNLVREKWELREVRITAMPLDQVPSNANDFAAMQLLGLASLIDFGMRLQSTYLTVPRQVPAELLRSPFFDSFSEAEDALEWNYMPQRAIIWTFPEPLFVPAGAKMYAEAILNAAEGANAALYTSGVKLRVALIGVRCADKPAPQKSRIPYATTFRTPKQAFGAAGNVQTFVAQDFQLKNHCKETLVVQRLTAWNTGDQTVPVSVRYSDSRNRMINRELAPLLELHSNGALNLHTILEPNEFISVEGEIDSTPVRQAISDGEESPIAATYEQQALFGLVGYREVDTNVLWSDSLKNIDNAQPVNVRTPPMLPYDVSLPPINPRLPPLPLPVPPFPPKKR